MPGMSGIEVLSEFRKWSNVPVIILSGKNQDTDKIAGRNIGADDYVTKPFVPVELVARVKTQLRRYLQLGGSRSSKCVRIGNLTLDDGDKRCS